MKEFKLAQVYKKRIISILLSTVIILSAFLSTPLNVFAESDSDSEIILSVLSYDSVDLEDIGKDGYTVRIISYVNAPFELRYSLIGSAHFSINEETGEITVKNTVKEGKYTLKIKAYAKDESIFDSVTKKLTVDIINRTVDDTQYYIRKNKAVIESYGGEYEELTIPSKLNGYPVSEIGYGAFKNNKHIKKITIPKGVKIIGEDAFSGCKNLEKVVFPKGLTTIDSGAFNNCKKLGEINIPNSATNIDSSAFDGTKWLKSKSKGVVYAGKVAYGYKGKTPKSITIKKGTLAIADSAFGCKKIQKVKLPKSLKIIGFGSFECTKLKSLVLPNKLEVIDDCAFDCCYNLRKVSFPKSVKNIGYLAFDSCIKLRKMVFKNKTMNVESDAFRATPWLESKPDGVVYIGKSAHTIKGRNPSKIKLKKGTIVVSDRFFAEHSSLKSVVIPKSVKEIGSNEFFDDTNLFSIKVEKGNKVYDSRNNCNAIIKKKGNELIYGCKKTKIPKSVKKIGDNAFLSCMGLKSIKLPAKLKSIGESAFEECSKLKSITIPKSVENIEPFAFYSCKKIKKVTIPQNVKAIGKYAFGFWSDRQVLGNRKIKGFSICGKKSSEANYYAARNKIKFIEN